MKLKDYKTLARRRKSENIARQCTVVVLFAFEESIHTSINNYIVVTCKWN